LTEKSSKPKNTISFLATTPKPIIANKFRQGCRQYQKCAWSLGSLKFIISLRITPEHSLMGNSEWSHGVHKIYACFQNESQQLCVFKGACKPCSTNLRRKIASTYSLSFILFFFPHKFSFQLW
jgi:hypothetical protein